MSEKLVLPRFDLPRDSTRTAIRVLWGTGGLMVAAILVLGVAMWHRHSEEIATAEQAAAKAAAARRAALAPPAPPVAPVKAGAAPGALVGSSETTMAAVIPATTPAAEPARHSGSLHPRHGAKSASHGRAGAHGAGAKGAPANNPAKNPAKKTKVDDDFIDKLLSK